MNERLNENLHQLFDGELDPNEMRRVLRAAAEDEEGLAMLNLEFRLRRTFGEEQRAASIPEGFADRVMKQVHLKAGKADPSPAAAADDGPWLSRLLGALVTPRPVVLRPAYAMAVIAVLAIGVVLALDRQGAAPQPVGNVDENIASVAEGASAEVLVPFVYVSADAASVGVAGDFNDWEPTRLQRKELNGRIVWIGHIPVTRGEHRYMFVVDGDRWESDPLAPMQRDDGFGNTNAILAL